MSAFTACAVFGSRRTSGHGNSPCMQASASFAAVATLKARPHGATSGSEPGGGVWIGTLQVMGPGTQQPAPTPRELPSPGSRSTGVPTR